MPEGESHPLLDWRAIAGAVAGQTVGREVVYLESTGSTNDDARQLGDAGAAEGVVLLAETQTAGRGRAGKSPWLTPAGTAVALSVLLRPRLAPEDLVLLSMAAGVAGVAAIREVAGLPADLKWPNDLLIRGRKVGGLLVESAISGTAVAYAVLGIGINANLRAAELGALPDAAIAPTTLLEEAGAPVAREALVIALLRGLEGSYAALRAGQAALVRQRYRDVLGTLGQRVRVLADGVALEGVAEDVTAAGELVVRLPDHTRRRFRHGEVTVRPSMSS